MQREAPVSNSLQAGHMTLPTKMKAATTYNIAGGLLWHVLTLHIAPEVYLGTSTLLCPAEISIDVPERDIFFFRLSRYHAA